MVRMGKALLLAMVLAMAGQTSAEDWSQLPELQAREAIAGSARANFDANRFNDLDHEMAGYVDGKVRTSSGLWASNIYYKGVLQAFKTAQDDATEADWDALDARTLAWAKHNPGSSLARIVHAEVIIDRAWRIRGYGYANTVPAGSWEPFHAGLRKAEDYLLGEKAVADKVPEYYIVLSEIARGEGKPRGEVDALLAECERRFPGYYPMYFSVLEYLLPQWNGDMDAIEDFALDAVRRTQGTEGRSMYARIYWSLAQNEEYEGAIFAVTKVQWPLMKAGFEDIVARYPDQWNYQNFARFACRASDDETLAELLAEHVHAPILDEAWEARSYYDSCASRVAPRSGSPEAIL
jgi:hypothetical protein